MSLYAVIHACHWEGGREGGREGGKEGRGDGGTEGKTRTQLRERNYPSFETAGSFEPRSLRPNAVPHNHRAPLNVLTLCQ